MSNDQAILRSNRHIPVLQAAPSKLAYTDITRMDRFSLRRELSSARHKGWFIIVSFLAILIGWGGTAPIAGGAMAPGTIMPEKGRQKIQHFEGGIISSILVEEGEKVKANQPLITLIDTRSRAGYDELMSRSLSLRARKARLEAEQQNSKELIFPKNFLTAPQEEVADLMTAQQRLFHIRQKTFKFKHQINLERLAQHKKSILGLKARLKSVTSQYDLNKRKLKTKRALYKKKLTTSDSIFTLENRKAKLFGEIGQLEADISKTRQKIAQVNIEFSVFQSEHFSSISLELEKLRGTLSTIEQNLKSSADVLKRTIIRSPVTGRVVGLQPTTTGGIIQRGQTLMTIAPVHDRLVINARISPNDIDIVYAGLKAKVMFPAYSMREAPTIMAKVRSISADSIRPKNGQEPYYLARVEVDMDELAKNAPLVKLVTGMQAHVLIVTKERTMLEYLLEPLALSLRKSMRES